MSSGVSFIGIVGLVLVVVVIGAVAAALIHAFTTNKDRRDD